MTHKLVLRQYIDLPFHAEGDFDHGDVALANGYVFIANTTASTVEVVDGEHLRHLVTIPDCPEASGVLVAQEEGLVFAAARGVGKLLVIDAVFTNVLREVAVGSRPNGLAWDPRRKHLLVADVQDNTARLVDPQAGQVIAAVSLPGRPRWAVYHESGDRFLVNMREPAVVVVLSASSFELVGQFPVSGVGPHGLDLDQEGHRAFIACDGGTVVTVDTSKGLELSQVPISGTPDAILHNHRLSWLYVAIQDPGMIDVVNTETMTVEEQIQTEVGTHTTAFDSRRQRLYVFLPSCRVGMYEESETG
jgi:DNA-binding beta-propeller fold protein YncE